MKKRAIQALAIILVLFFATLMSFTPIIQPVKAQEESTSFSDDFSSDSSNWQLLGSAYRDATNKDLVLTSAANMQGGVAFFKTPIQGSFTASFRYKAGGGGCHGDGFTMFFYKQQYSTIGDGGSLGFTPNFQIVPGYGIEFDAWQNIHGDFLRTTGSQANVQGDPSEHHIALIEGFSGDHLTYVDDQRVGDNNWHSVTVKVQGSSVSVSIDQATVIQWTGTLNRTYDGFGFSGANGGCGSDWHIIDDFSLIAADLHTPIITTSCISPQSQAGFNTFEISGDLTFNGAGISGAPIYLSYSVNGGETWQDLTLIYTHDEGSYSATWLPTVTGNYQLKAVYRGSENYLGTSNTINFAIEPFANQNVFSVTSNSTVTGLFFDSANDELRLNVTGTSGTVGYVNVYIPKSILSDVSSLKVSLDGNQIQYTNQSQNDCWLISFTYHHSSHAVTISLGSSTLNPSTTTSQTDVFGLDWVKIGILVFMAAILAVVAVTAIKLLSRKTPK